MYQKSRHNRVTYINKTDEVKKKKIRTSRIRQGPQSDIGKLQFLQEYSSQVINKSPRK